MRETLRGALLSVLFFALLLGGAGLAFADDSGSETGGGDQKTYHPNDKNKNGKQDWWDSSFYQDDCKKATVIRDAGAVVAMGSTMGGFAPGIFIGGAIAIWGQAMVWSSC